MEETLHSGLQLAREPRLGENPVPPHCFLRRIERRRDDEATRASLCLQVILRELEKLRPVQRLDRRPAGTVVIADARVQVEIAFQFLRTAAVTVVSFGDEERPDPVFEELHLLGSWTLRARDKRGRKDQK